MKHRTLIPALAAAALATVFASTTTQAQDTTRKESRGDVAKTVAFSTVIASIDGIPAEITRLKAIPALAPAAVHVLNVATIPMANDSLLTAALDRNKAAVADLQKELEANAVVKEALAKETPPLSTSDVIAIRVTPDNTVQVFYRKAM